MTEQMKVEDLVILHEDNHIIVVLKPQNVPSCEDESKDKDMLTVIKEYIKIKNNYLAHNDHNHPSFVCYVEAVHNVYHHMKSKKLL